MPPRGACFGPTETVPIEQRPTGSPPGNRPLSPGISGVVPGERLDRPVGDCLRTGHEIGTNIPGATDTAVKSVRVYALTWIFR